MRFVTKVLERNKDFFTWTSVHMLGVHRLVMSHKLSVCKKLRSVAQKKRPLREKCKNTIEA